MNDSAFLDTNIFAYSFDKTAPEKKKRASALIKAQLVRGTGVISYQVVQEFINVSYRKFSSPMSLRELERFIEDVLSHLWKVYASRDLIYSAKRNWSN
jgi:predicted nucleic acid-binding protein